MVKNFESEQASEAGIQSAFTGLRPRNLMQQASTRSGRLIDDLVRGLLAGRIEHELRPSAQFVLSDLESLLSRRELELLKQGILQTRSHPLGKNIQGVITSLLKGALEELESFSDSLELNNNSRKGPSAIFNVDDSSQARLLGILRDLALELADFLERSESDGISELQELLTDCQQKFEQRSDKMRLAEQQSRIAQHFLLKVSSSIFFDKLEMVLQDYLASGTDYNLVSGKVWASRYRRADYIQFFFESVQSLKQSYSWIFEDSEAFARISSIQIQVKASQLRSPVHIQSVSVPFKKSLEGILLEMRALFGIGLNCLMRNEGDLALRFFERVLTCSADAIEHPEQKSITLSQRLSRLRVQAHFCIAEAEVLDARLKLARYNDRNSIAFAKNIFEKKSLKIRASINKAKYELELLGLSGLAIDVDGTAHDKLEGLSEWVNSVIMREETLFLYELSSSLNMHRQAHSDLCSHLATLLGMKSLRGTSFEELRGRVRIDIRSGAESKSFWRTKEVYGHGEDLLEEVCQRMQNLDSDKQEEVIRIIPLLIFACFEFEDFDAGFSLVLAHRHMFGRVLAVVPGNPDFELLQAMVDSEVRFRFALFKREAKAAQDSALGLLTLSRQKENKGFFRSIDPKRQYKLAQAVKGMSDTGPLKNFNDFQQSRIISEGIHGHFVSQEIRMLGAVTRQTRGRGLSRDLSDLVMSRVQTRLSLTAKDVQAFREYQNQEQSSGGLKGSSWYLEALSIESMSLAAIQMLLDASLSCAIAQDERRSRMLLSEANKSYAAIFPGLSFLVDSILAAQSIEEFRRRVENSIELLRKEALGGELSLVGTASGAALGFLLSSGSAENLLIIFQRFLSASSIARRRIVAGRCKPLERYAVAHYWARLQRHVISSVVALNDNLSCESQTVA